jgi:hypothetical protein
MCADRITVGRRAGKLPKDYQKAGIIETVVVRAKKIRELSLFGEAQAPTQTVVYVVRQRDSSRRRYE